MDHFLHPGFQRQLLRAFLEGPLKTVQVFATTQSNHLLEIGLESDEVSVFAISKDATEEPLDAEYLPKFSVRKVSADDQILLNELGVNKASVMLANCVIMVEGVTDRWYYQRLLECYWRSKFDSPNEELPFTLDLHYTFAEYGGSCLSHYDFMPDGDITTSRLLGKYFCIADLDSSGWKKDRNEWIKRNIDEAKGIFFPLPCREVENLLSMAIVKEILESDFGRKYPFLDSISTSVEEAYLRELPANDFPAIKGSASYYKIQIVPLTQRKDLSKAKINFCKNAMHRIKSIHDFAPVASIVAEKIHDFILDHNKERASRFKR